ncbi:hypothetical protein [Methanomassiliicoccus luminyensis]|mgnify:CR=1 FL=1|uniref:hypothetical protein n=1 Tax=Methanomassiliicoccus luminyensis TaxID=1080712 RepID=UPI00035CCDBA|nr:hypothetical protein [Methanomassiliicoccus luminyensis]
MHEPQIKYKDDRSKDYRVVYVSDIFGGHQIDYFEVTIRTISINASQSETSGEAVLDRVEQVCLKMSPQQAKIFRDWLEVQLDNYEKKFGKISFNEEVGDEERGIVADVPETGVTDPGVMFR